MEEEHQNNSSFYENSPFLTPLLWLSPKPYYVCCILANINACSILVENFCGVPFVVKVLKRKIWTCLTDIGLFVLSLIFHYILNAYVCIQLVVLLAIYIT